MTEQGAALVLTDSAGCLLDVRLPGGLDLAGSALALEPGRSWAESVRGTNAFGTALAEGRTVLVERGAHFARPLATFTTAAAPVAAASGEAIAALGCLVPGGKPPALLEAVLIAGGSAIERALHGRAYGRIAARLLATAEEIIDRLPRPTLLVLPPGRVHSANPAARGLFGGRLGMGRATRPEDLIDCDFDILVGYAAEGESVSIALPTGETGYLRVEPVFDDRNRPVALIVDFDTKRAVRGVEFDIDHPPEAAPAFDVLLGSDPDLASAKAVATRFARTRLPVMILSETGTGKELMANAIHAASDRAEGPFVALNCGALPAGLLESELFGYGPGAFTGARKDGAPGKLAAADGGTLFLDELGDMPTSLQVMLLRFLEDGGYYGVGEETPRSADVRVVCATSRSLEQMVGSGTFRKDLYYRLKGVTLQLPPLRARRDIADLASGLLARIGRELQRTTVPVFEDGVLSRLAAHSWPGNVRELRAVLHHALVLCGTGDVIRGHHLPGEVGVNSPGATFGRGESAPPAVKNSSALLSSAVEVSSADVDGAACLEDIRMRALLAAVDRHGGNVSAASRELGVARSTIYRALRRSGRK
ncbi:sigma 54-interacting transcriptional regulator [Planctomycetes bacterium Poly30]|uniref:sigma-54-dependent Fis family transcriptional regulator n=1 Tax=Saltatorellus ferox TaxID=2528018 RepID=UPI0011A773A9